MKFEKLYDKVCKSFTDKNVIVMTHMPLSDWYERAAKEKETQNEIGFPAYNCYHPRFVYVSGHNHRNMFFDDNVVRVYSDNQFGYQKSRPSAMPHLKSFEMCVSYDYFSDYEDGIFEITADEYRHFLSGMNKMATFYRDINVLYMLKKNGYYCFIHQSKTKDLSILNGGALKKLANKDIKYYYDNMDYVIAISHRILEKYSSLQKKIAEDIRKIGGSGTIHGCIINIDFYNHIYLNPDDASITAYRAKDMIDKVVYPSIPDLLEAECPKLFITYNKLLSYGSKNDLPALSSSKTNPRIKAPVPYYKTDLYRISRQVNKLQKLDYHILSLWPDKLPKQKRKPKSLESSK